MKETTELVDKLLNGESPAQEILLSEIFTVKYKEGPVMKWVNIKARNAEHAAAEAQKFLLHVQSRENHRVVLVGKPEPLAIIVDEEIEKWTRKNRPHTLNQENSGSSVLSSASMPNSP